MSNLQALLVIQSNSCCSCANQVLESPKDGRPKKGATAAVFANEQIMYSGFRIDWQHAERCFIWIQYMDPYLIYQSKTSLCLRLLGNHCGCAQVYIV